MRLSRNFYLENARWLGAGFGLTLASSFGQTFFISLFAGEIRAVYGLTDGGWGALYTAATLGSALVLFQAGALVDRVRLDRLAPALLAAYAVAAVAMAAGPWAGPLTGAPLLWLGLTVFALRLCGQGMMGHMAITAMGRWFRARRGRAVAFAGLGFSLGEAALPAAALAVAALIGWRETWLVVAAVLALGAAPLMARLLAEGRAPQGEAGGASHPGLGGRHWTRAEVLRHWLFWALMPLLLTPPFIGTVLFFHQVHISDEKAWPLAVMAAGYPVYAGLTVAASLAGGALVDRTGPARLLAVFLLPMGGAMAALAVSAEGPGAVWGWMVVMALTGLTQGLAQALWGALWPELYGTRHLGAVRAVGTTAMVFSTAAGPGITGLLIDGGVSFPAQAAPLGVFCVAVSALGLIASRAALEARRGAAPGTSP